MSNEEPSPENKPYTAPKPSLPRPSVKSGPSETPRMASFEVEATPPAVSPRAAESVDRPQPAPVVEETILHKRLLAGAIDCAIAFGPVVVISQTLPSLGKVALALQIAYLLTRDCLPFLDGQSIGKKILHLRAVTADGQPLTNQWQPGILRNILFVVPAVGPLVELIVLYTREEKPERGLRLGDGFAGTKVIQVPRQSTHTAVEGESTSSE